MTKAGARGVLAIMGSGETSPTMVSVHRDLMGKAGGEAAILGTSYAFQENADEISSRAVDYFATSVGESISVVDLGSAGAPEEERALEQLRRASYIFAGPGSPSYALRRWRGTSVPAVFTDRLAAGATVVFASAAALTLGRWTVPVYEIYKAGLDPEWLDGIDLFGAVGMNDVAVIPHFDNREGGHHDTRFCYLGESRLRQMEQQLDDTATVLGVDEHTVCVIDFERGTIGARGRGGVTLRRAGQVVGSLTDSEVGIDEFFSTERGDQAPPRTVSSALPVTPSADTPFMERVGSFESAFENALTNKEFESAVEAVLELESEIVAWAADTMQSDEVDRARRSLRRMIQRLAEAGEQAGTEALDSNLRADGLTNALVELRDKARTDSQFDLSDRIRDLLAASGVEVRDTPEGQQWSRVPLPATDASPSPDSGKANP